MIICVKKPHPSLSLRGTRQSKITWNCLWFVNLNLFQILFTILHGCLIKFSRRGVLLFSRRLHRFSQIIFIFGHSLPRIARINSNFFKSFIYLSLIWKSSFFPQIAQIFADYFSFQFFFATKYTN